MRPNSSVLVTFLLVLAQCYIAPALVLRARDAQSNRNINSNSDARSTSGTTSSNGPMCPPDNSQYCEYKARQACARKCKECLDRDMNIAYDQDSAYDRASKDRPALQRQGTLSPMTINEDGAQAESSNDAQLQKSTSLQAGEMHHPMRKRHSLQRRFLDDDPPDDDKKDDDDDRCPTCGQPLPCSCGCVDEPIPV